MTDKFWSRKYKVRLLIRFRFTQVIILFNRLYFNTLHSFLHSLVTQSNLILNIKHLSYGISEKIDVQTTFLFEKERTEKER